MISKERLEKSKETITSDNPERQRWAASISRQIEEPSRSFVETFREKGGIMVGIPVVGFEGQSETSLPLTLEALGRVEWSPETLVVFLVNRPSVFPPDETLDRIKEFIERNRLQNWVTAEVTTRSVKARGTPMGDLRSAIYDAVIDLAFPPGEESTNKEEVLQQSGLIILDGDIVEIPPEFIREWQKQLRERGFDLGIGPMKFDNPSYPSVLFPPLWAGMKLVKTLGEIIRDEARRKEEGFVWIWAKSFDFGAYSNICLRGSFYQEIGGLPAINEITKTVRSGLARGARVEFVEGPPITTQSLRELATYLERGYPPAYKWTISPFRVKDPTRDYNPGEMFVKPIKAINPQERTRLCGEIEMQINLSLAALDILDSLTRQEAVAIISKLLISLGLGQDDYQISSQITKNGLKFKVHINNWEPLFDRLGQEQEKFISQKGLRMETLLVDNEVEREGYLYFAPEYPDFSKEETGLIRLPIQIK